MVMMELDEFYTTLRYFDDSGVGARWYMIEFTIRETPGCTQNERQELTQYISQQIMPSSRVKVDLVVMA
jgi:hypothetical protein